MKLRLVVSFLIFGAISCGVKNEDSELEAVKGEGWFKNGYLFALSSPNDPGDRCWYYNSKFKTPFTTTTPQQDSIALQQATPLTFGSVTPDYLADLLSAKLQSDRNNQQLASSLATGACAVSGTITIANPAAKLGSVIFCTGIKETLFQILRNASSTAEKGSSAVDRSAATNDKAIVKVPKDVTNLFRNALKNVGGDGEINSCAELQSQLTVADYNRMAGVRTTTAQSAASCKTYKVNVAVAKVYSGSSSQSTVYNYGIGRGVVVDVASPYQANPLYRIYVKPRAGTTYEGQGVWMDQRDLLCIN